jgi:hypothetical protein
MNHDDECDKVTTEGGICTCEAGAGGDAAYFAEPADMADLEDGTAGNLELW